jgi:transcriptional regulator with XRE-family HTH domain
MQPSSTNPIRLARDRAGLDQIAVALRARISLSTLRLAERGIASTRTRAAIARALGIDVDALLGRKGEQP